MTDTLDILIVGAGPSGLTAAVELSRRGIIPTVIERRTSASNLSRAVGILPGSMRLLAPSGAADGIAAEAVTVRDAIFHHHDKAFARIPLSERGDAYQRLFALAQDRTEAHLLEALKQYGGAVQYDAELTGLTANQAEVKAVINGEERRFSHVIGADGISSTVRQAMGISFDGYDLPETWSIADVDATEWPEADCFKAFFLAEGQAVIVVPLETARFRVISNLPDALAALPVAMNVTRVRREGTFTISVRQASSYREGRVFLVGDAAHCHSPVGGRGMNLGIADAADLAKRFLEGGLEGYHAARHAEGQRVIRLSEMGRKAVMGKCGPCRFFVRHALKLGSHLPFLRSGLVHRILN